MSTVTTTTSSSNVTVSTATTASGSAPSTAAAASAASSSKLSYAQMVARKMEAEKQQQLEAEQQQANNISNGPSTKPAALRDQSQLTSRQSSSKSSSSDNFVRKDYRSDESLRPNNGRRAKENRDRRGPPLDSKDRFRERRRSDRDDLRPAYASKWLFNQPN